MEQWRRRGPVERVNTDRNLAKRQIKDDDLWLLAKIRKSHVTSCEGLLSDTLAVPGTFYSVGIR
jgi:hypothetical protein